MSVNPSVSLSFLPLGNVVEYYADWSIRMMCLLRSLNCADCLEEEEESSHQPTPKQIAEKKQKDAKAMEAVYRHLSAYALNIIREKKTVKEVWSALKHAYEDKSPANQLHLFDKLLQLKMAENEDVMLHFAKFDSIINELRCSGAQAINDEQFLCCVLLRSMNINYKQAVTAIAMTSKDDLQIETVKANLRTYSLTLTEVKEEKTTEDPSASASAMFVSGQGDNFKFNHGNHQYYRGQKRGNQRGRGNRGTSFRGQGFRGQGFRGQGFRGQGFRGQNFKAKYRVHTPNSNNAMFCTYCNRFNHLEKDCRYKARDQKSPKNSTNPSNQVNMAGEEDSFGFVGLTISG
ncbi:uncharacterized protein LOC135837772 [Planococcus citri]|uniref:uncharacterized protein LOC135837772 n=1 Tax=Planococcus citri TaxID=170843 RepID=UPI0031F77ED4